LKEAYELIRYRMRLEKINWVETSNMHITLSFLGDTNENLIPGIIKAIRNTADQFQPFELVLKSFGVFKNLHDPRVLWFGCDAPEMFSRIKKMLDDHLLPLGFDPENRHFAPHLTLGRVKDLRQLNQLGQLITLYKDAVIQKQQIDRIVYYESRLTTQGAVYVPIRTFQLGVGL
jgi:2'-5' RNA ligase